MTKFESIAATNVRNGFNALVDGYYTLLEDDSKELLPTTVTEAFDEMYLECIHNHFSLSGACYCGHAPKEMRFAGRKFIRNYLYDLWKKEERLNYIAELQGWTELKKEDI